MKKSTLLLFACLALFKISNAQDSKNQKAKVVSENIYTALKPADATPYVFGSQQDLNDKQASKKGAVLSEIKANANDPQKLQTLRESLWRIENATVQIKK